MRQLNVNGVMFLLGGSFEKLSISPSPLHKHYSYEIHIMVSGSVIYYIDGRELQMTSGKTYIIKKDLFHRLLSKSPDAESIVFQVSRKPRYEIYYNDSHLISCLIKEINKSDYKKIKAYLEVLSCDLFRDDSESNYESEEVDIYYLIYEYFNIYYNKDISLENLSQELNLCKRQTTRYIKTFMGGNFLSTLARYRLDAAEELLRHTNMKVTEIASTVGYKTYMSFLSAFKKFYLKTPAELRKSFHN